MRRPCCRLLLVAPLLAVLLAVLAVLAGCDHGPDGGPPGGPDQDTPAQAGAGGVDLTQTPGATPQPSDRPAPTPTATQPAIPPATVTQPAIPPVTVTRLRPYGPTATPRPTAMPRAAPISFESYRDGNCEIYVLEPRTGELVNLTRHPAEDRAPAWRPDGGALAFESHRDGNWEIYLLELGDGSLTRLTGDPAYDGAPAWSPDGRSLAFESYRDGNLEVYVVAATGGQPRRLTEDPAGDYGPAWSPDSRSIAFTSWRDGDKEIYVVPADGGQARNLSNNPADDEDPAWAPDGAALAFVSWRDVDPETGNRNAEIYRVTVAEPAVGAVGGVGAQHAAPLRVTENRWPDLDPGWDNEGRLVWAAYDPGPPFETFDPYRPGSYHLYRQGVEGPERLTQGDGDDRRPAPAPARTAPPDGLVAHLPPEPARPAPLPALLPGAPAQVVEVPSMLVKGTNQPILVNELVRPSLEAWQEDVRQASGWDFLGTTLGTWRTIDQVRKKALYAYDYGYLSWHKAGRALDLALDWRKVDGVDQMVRVREDLGADTYWRMYLRAARQDGTQGEPLKENPWQYWWQIVPEEDPEAYAAGGRRLPIPEGYYVDVTALARRHGWERIASYAIDGDYHWHSDSNGTEYWHYERTDGLTWWDAMRRIYPPEKLEEYVGWEAGLRHAQSEAMMRSKGVPAP